MNIRPNNKQIWKDNNIVWEIIELLKKTRKVLMRYDFSIKLYKMEPFFNVPVFNVKFDFTFFDYQGFLFKVKSFKYNTSHFSNFLPSSNVTYYLKNNCFTCLRSFELN